MTAILHDRSVLVLNRHWVAVDAITPAEAFSHLFAETARALEISGTDSIRPLAWPAWRELPVTPGCRSIGTARGAVLIPAVIVLTSFDRIPLRVPRFGLSGVWQRDGGRCQYTGRLLAPGEGDIDHIIPRSRGGTTSWDNCVLADRRINRHKAAKTPEEAGLRLLRPPVAPRPMPASALLQNSHHIPEWELFLSRGVRGTSPSATAQSLAS